MPDCRVAIRRNIAHIICDGLLLGAVMKNLELASPQEMSASARAGEITLHPLRLPSSARSSAMGQNREKLT